MASECLCAASDDSRAATSQTRPRCAARFLVSWTVLLPLLHQSFNANGTHGRTTNAWISDSRVLGCTSSLTSRTCFGSLCSMLLHANGQESRNLLLLSYRVMRHTTSWFEHCAAWRLGRRQTSHKRLLSRSTPTPRRRCVITCELFGHTMLCGMTTSFSIG